MALRCPPKRTCLVVARAVSRPTAMELERALASPRLHREASRSTRLGTSQPPEHAPEAPALLPSLAALRIGRDLPCWADRGPVDAPWGRSNRPCLSGKARHADNPGKETGRSPNRWDDVTVAAARGHRGERVHPRCSGTGRTGPHGPEQPTRGSPRPRRRPLPSVVATLSMFFGASTRVVVGEAIQT